ncbi:nucleoside-diphosphate sugar epimerase [Alteromonas mediterranea]|uniref:nucleoside-diphosphate sugar epimerase/dehydratase n=1 Tax=Alteromonas mediterranea TaxID=314275 RepID=UPI00090321C9|nr:nucleoside-diphosphate sugar epimerase/dehydratase [Alteromonas mediterranea]APE03245.1 nucleoside-diphosphate sugar epimerase [Alteromonas mediterranea]
METIVKTLLSLPRAQKRIITVLIDAVFILTSFWAAMFIRLDSLSSVYNADNWLLVSLVIPVSVFIFVKLGLYRAVLRYVGINALGAVVGGITASCFTLIGLSFFLSIPIPRTVPIIFVSFSILLVGGSRIIVRALVSKVSASKRRPVIIYGAGSAGRQLATALRHGPEYRVVAFVDDDRTKQGSQIEGHLVLAVEDLKSIIQHERVEKILLALPSTSRARRNRILQKLEVYSVKVQTIPGMADVVAGAVNVDQVKDVDVEDLLGRDPVSPKKALLHADIKEKVVMVTGAGGSIGSELCRQIVRNGPTKLVLFELSEFALYSIEKELSQYVEERSLPISVIPIMGSVQKQNRLETVMSAFGVQTVYHAAAYKHVPLVEHNVVEGVRNNIFGTLYTAQAAIKTKVETFVLVSTDKAVRPTNVMGTTKRMSELVLQALADTQSDTRFCMVRFGNVLGSSGSVVPLFRKQIRKGGPVTLTHQDITRYFMTIPEAAQLVIQAGAMGMGGDVFVLDMGDPVKIKDLAMKMIHLSGFTVKDEKEPEGDIEIKCTGLRPGEKLYEELLIGDNVEGTTHERIMTAHESKLDWRELEVILNSLDEACHYFEHERIRDILLKAPTGFAPTDEICDLVWLERQLASTKKAEELKLTH